MVRNRKLLIYIIITRMSLFVENRFHFPVSTSSHAFTSVSTDTSDPITRIRTADCNLCRADCLYNNFEWIYIERAKQQQQTHTHNSSSLCNGTTRIHLLYYNFDRTKCSSNKIEEEVEEDEDEEKKKKKREFQISFMGEIICVSNAMHVDLQMISTTILRATFSPYFINSLCATKLYYIHIQCVT